MRGGKVICGREGLTGQVVYRLRGGRCGGNEYPMVGRLPEDMRLDGGRHGVCARCVERSYTSIPCYMVAIKNKRSGDSRDAMLHHNHKLPCISYHILLDVPLLQDHADISHGNNDSHPRITPCRVA
jgi:hypothetical protein